MKYFLKFMKYLGALVLIVVLLYIFLAKFSSVDSRFECSGTMSSGGQSKPATVYIKLTEYSLTMSHSTNVLCVLYHLPESVDQMCQ
jgi:hypothetical protein